MTSGIDTPEVITDDLEVGFITGDSVTDSDDESPPVIIGSTDNDDDEEDLDIEEDLGL